MCSKSHRLPRETGFTLIEILIAVAILGTVSAVAYISFSSTIGLRDAALAEAARAHEARNGLGLMAEELAVSRQHPQSRWIGRNADQDGRAADLLLFNTSSHVRVQSGAPETDMARVLYTREKDRLVRYSIRNPYAFTTDAIDRTDIATGVLAFNLRYFDRRARSWADQWSEGLSASVPTGVLIELTLSNGQQSPRTYTAWVLTGPISTSQKP